MAKIVHLPRQQSLIANLEIILEKAKRGEFTDYVFAAKCTDGDIATSWKADLGTRQELNSHIQIDIMMGVVEVNLT